MSFPLLVSRFLTFAGLVLVLAYAGCAVDNQPPLDANTAPLPNQSLRPGLNSPDTVNPLSGSGAGTGVGPLSPGGFSGTGTGAVGGAGGHR